MSRFKVGDKVRRTGNSFGGVIQGKIYEVSEVSPFTGINLVGHEIVGGRYNYDNRGFELYADDILTPTQAAEAIFNNIPLQLYDTDEEKWYGFPVNLRGITLEDLRHMKLRLKPKTVVINGVEVPAPTNKEDIEHYFYTVNFSEATVHCVDELYIHNNFKYFWATEEDAQKVLDAMLMPFK